MLLHGSPFGCIKLRPLIAFPAIKEIRGLTKPTLHDRLARRFGEHRMSFFIDYLWIWIVLTFIVGICGFLWYHNNRTSRNFVIAITLPLLTLALGLILYYGVNTDQKSIKRMLDALIVAVERDDLESVSQFIHPKAHEIQQLAKISMGFGVISRAKYHDLEIEVNDAASPPVAKVRFSAVFYWINKEPIEGFTLDRPVLENARFELELIKTKSRTWLLTDKYRYSVRNFHEII